MLFSTYSTKKFTIISHIHSKLLLSITINCWLHPLFFFWSSRFAPILFVFCIPVLQLCLCHTSSCWSCILSRFMGCRSAKTCRKFSNSFFLFSISGKLLFTVYSNTVILVISRSIRSSCYYWLQFRYVMHLDMWCQMFRLQLLLCPSLTPLKVLNPSHPIHFATDIHLLSLN